MEIKGKVHCLFEQSETFKKEFIKLGIPAEDYDIQNNFGQTDHQDDLFQAIDDAYDGKPSLFDNITKDDLVIAFFPCIYFCGNSQILFMPCHRNYRNFNTKEKFEKILQREKDRTEFHSRLMRLIGYAEINGIRLVIENPAIDSYLLVNHFLKKPDIIDRNRMVRGDYYVKPTAYWFWNCTPENGLTIQNDKVRKTISNSKSSGRAGLCSEERSMISPDYARNWICDFILGKNKSKEESK